MPTTTGLLYQIDVMFHFGREDLDPGYDCTGKVSPNDSLGFALLHQLSSDAEEL